MHGPECKALEGTRADARTSEERAHMVVDRGVEGPQRSTPWINGGVFLTAALNQKSPLPLYLNDHDT